MSIGDADRRVSPFAHRSPFDRPPREVVWPGIAMVPGGIGLLLSVLGLVRLRLFSRRYDRYAEFGLKGGLWRFFRASDMRWAFVTLAVGIILTLITILGIVSLIVVGPDGL